MVPYLLITNNEKACADKITELKTKNGISDNLVFEFRPDGTTFKIETVRSVISFINTVGKEKKMLVLYDFDLCRIESQNAILKTLEEKNVNNLFVLTAASRGALLETILSRCKTIRLVDKKPRKSPDDELNIENDQYLTLLQKYEGIDKEKATRVCDLILRILRAKLKSDLSYASKIKEVIKAKRLLEKNNVNAQMTIDHIIYTITH